MNTPIYSQYALLLNGVEVARCQAKPETPRADFVAYLNALPEYQGKSISETDDSFEVVPFDTTGKLIPFRAGYRQGDGIYVSRQLENLINTYGRDCVLNILNKAFGLKQVG